MESAAQESLGTNRTIEIIKTTALTVCSIGATLTTLFANGNSLVTIGSAGIGFGCGIAVVAKSPKEPSRKQRDLWETEAKLRERETAIASIETERQKWLESQQKELNEYAQKLRNDAELWAQSELEARAVSLVTDHNQKVSILSTQHEQLQRYEQRLRQFEAELKAVVPNTTSVWESKFLEQQTEYENYVAECEQWRVAMIRDRDNYKKLLDNLYAKVYGEKIIELKQLKQPVMPPVELYESSPRVAMVAERTLRFLHEKLGASDLTCDFVGGFEEKGGIAVAIRPKKFPLLYTETLQAVSKLLPALASFCPGCNANPAIVPTFNGIRIDWDNTGDTNQTRTARAKMTQISEPPSDWMEAVVSDCFHFRVNGQSGSGKSTFVNNLIGLMRRMYGDALTIVLIDPKYPMSRWSIRPQYRGLEQSIVGLKAMSEEVLLRLRLATEDADAGKPIREFDPILFVLDEVDMVAAEYNDPTPVVAEYLKELELGSKKAAAHLLKQGLKVGRALRVMVAYLGQSPLCSALGMNRNDFNHSANLFLGENIPSAIEEVALKHQQGWLMAQYKLRIARYMESKGSPVANDYKYFGLVKVPGEAPFLAPLPPEGAYDWVFFQTDASGQRVIEPCVPTPETAPTEPTGAFESVHDAIPESPHDAGDSQSDAGAGGTVRTLESLDPGNPDDLIEIQQRLNHQLRAVLVSDIVAEVRSLNEVEVSQPIDWHDAIAAYPHPVDLVESVRTQLESKIASGILKPFDLVKSVWSGTIDPNRKPYKGKGGVKELVELMILNRRK